MRVGLSWDLEQWSDATVAWQAVIAEIEQADQMGYHSAWVNEARGADVGISSPGLFMTYAARRTRCIQLRVAGRQVAPHHPVRIAEEVAVLDNFSFGRAGIAFASGSSQGVSPQHVHELVDFVSSAWACDAMRYRGDYIRFPAHTPDDAPLGTSEQEAVGEHVPQWDWGPVMPDFLAVTPNPYVLQPPVNVVIEDDETLEWAAQSGIAPMIGADMSTREAVERLARYREVADKAGRSRREVEAVLERRIHLDAAADDSALGGSTADVLNAIRELRAQTFISHFVWRRNGSTPMDLFRFASEVQMLLQT